MAIELIPLTRGMVAIVDAADYALVAPYRWYAHKGKKTWYARADVGGRVDRRRIYMRRLLCEGQSIDHRDGDGLNNCRANLRPATESQNQANRRKAAGTSSTFKGVTFDRNRGKWLAQIVLDGRRVHLGRTDDELLAAARYDIAAKAAFGEFATSNLGVTW